MHADHKTYTDLDKAIADTFPASDPPSATSPVAATPAAAQVPATDAGLGCGDVRIFRIIEPRQASHPFSGAGSDSGGRWTSPRVEGVYASLSPAMAMLEYLVHVEGATPDELLMAHASLPVECMLAQLALPSDWRERPYRAGARQVGDEWSKTRRSVALRVPSALMAEEFNVLLNPAHPDFVKLRLEQLTPLRVDPRLRI